MKEPRRIQPRRTVSPELKAKWEARRALRLAQAPLKRRAKNFFKAWWRHVRSGMPIASPSDMEKRFEVCRSNLCGKFKKETDDTGKCTHAACGCNVKRLGTHGLNKLRWAEQECPAKLWGQVSPWRMGWLWRAWNFKRRR